MLRRAGRHMAIRVTATVPTPEHHREGPAAAGFWCARPTTAWPEWPRDRARRAICSEFHHRITDHPARPDRKYDLDHAYGRHLLYPNRSLSLGPGPAI
jgi:hypothetical protein